MNSSKASMSGMHMHVYYVCFMISFNIAFMHPEKTSSIDSDKVSGLLCFIQVQKSLNGDVGMG